MKLIITTIIKIKGKIHTTANTKINSSATKLTSIVKGKERHYDTIVYSRYRSKSNSPLSAKAFNIK
jgi:hypothetical protein